jgi:cell fate regulator YaaT (PSP1 superfamily)
MKKLIVNFPNINKQYLFEVNDADYKVGDNVLVENNQIIEDGFVADYFENDAVLDLEDGVGSIIRCVNEDDKKKITILGEKAIEYLIECREYVEKYQLPMKLINAQLSFDEKKLTIFFGAEGRVDFRQLVTELIKKYKKLIRLQQIGARDEAKIVGGFGKCGREFCCKKFLKKVDSVTLDMAKDQDMSTGISKISGACGKLMCCLSYELEAYKNMKEKLPKVGEKIKTQKGIGKIVDVNVVASSLVVQLDNGERIKEKYDL